MQNKSDALKAAPVSPAWMSPAAVALRLGISRAQVSRLAARHAWKRLDVSTSPKAKNAGVRYAVSSIEDYERHHSY